MHGTDYPIETRLNASSKSVGKSRHFDRAISRPPPISGPFTTLPRVLMLHLSLASVLPNREGDAEAALCGSPV
jgi:hypothetical protein